MVAIPRPPDPAPPHQEARPVLRLLPRRRPSVEGHRGGHNVQLTPRDVAILRDLTRFYALTVEQLARRHFGAEPTAYHRLTSLARAGLVVLHRPFYRGPGVYLVTPVGARASGLDLPAPRYRPQAMRHHLAVADVTHTLLTKYAKVSGIGWTCERELRRASMATVRDGRTGNGRLTAGVPHVPDGVLATPSARWAVEVELSKKIDAEYRRILRWYATQQGYRRVVWYGSEERIRRRLGELIARERLDDLMSVLPLPDGVTLREWG